MLIVPTNDATGHRMVKTQNVVRGITVSRNLGSEANDGAQSMLGGRVGAVRVKAE